MGGGPYLVFLSGGENVKMSSPSKSSLNRPPELLDVFLAALGSVGVALGGVVSECWLVPKRSAPPNMDTAPAGFFFLGSGRRAHYTHTHTELTYFVWVGGVAVGVDPNKSSPRNRSVGSLE